MGIKNLTKIIEKHSSIKKVTISKYSKKKIAIDASLCLYQFLVAIRSDSGNLTDNNRETSHLSGLFYRTIRFLENNIKVVYVFDGAPPIEKAEELQKRENSRNDAKLKEEEAYKEGDMEMVQKQQRRQVRITDEHISECKRLLECMGVPYVVAPSEAEAYCAQLCKNKIIDAVATEDMDTVTFGSPILLRNLNKKDSKEIWEFDLKKILKDLELDQKSFVDLCILLGCDYSKTLKGVGTVRAFDLIKKHKNIEAIMENLNIEQDDFYYKESREMFEKEYETEDIEFDLKLKSDDLIEFLVKEKNFSEDRILKGIERLKKVRKNNRQKGLSAFFTRK